MSLIYKVCAILLIATSCYANALPPALPKVIGVYPTEDRWITLTDGSKVFEGAEISYLLQSRLLASHYESVGLTSASVAPTGAALDFTITPVVEALQYTSGEKSDRLVFGFTPDHLNPFNQGRSGALDNEFVATAQQQSDCVLPDFYNGMLTPAGYGPLAGNYGSDLDQGASFQVAGYGLGFKTMYFQVDSQIRFIVQNSKDHSRHDIVLKTTGSGRNLFVTGSYQGYMLGLTLQRRSTLIEALNQMLPQIVDQLVKAGFEASPSPSTKKGGVHAKDINSTIATVIQQNLGININPTTAAAAQVTTLKNCFNKPTAFVEDIVDSAALPYALYKYEEVLDQPLTLTTAMPANKPLRIAMIDSGIDYNDDDFTNHVDLDRAGQLVGYDFISDDPRPSDDNGHGTAVAKYLMQQLGGRPFTLVPIKAIGSHGETSSSAVYDSFQFAVQQAPDAILVAWGSSASTQTALKMGTALATQAHIPVFTVKASTPAPGTAPHSASKPAAPSAPAAPKPAAPKPAAPSAPAAPTAPAPVFTGTSLGGASLSLDAQSATAVSALLQSLTTHPAK